MYQGSLGEVYGVFGFHLVESLEENAGFAYLVAGHETAFLALLFVYLLLAFLDLDAFGRIDHVNDGLRSSSFHLLDKFPYVTAVCERTVDAFGRKIV